MSALTELRPASFRGVPFLVKSTSTVGGRRTVSHEFVNADFREVEDLGLSLKQFTINAVVATEVGDTETHLSKKIALMDALDQKGSGILTHPFYGEFEVVSGLYTIGENMTRLGETEFTLIFEVETDELAVEPFSNVYDDVVNKKKTVENRTSLDVAKGYFNTTKAAIDSTTDFVNDLSSRIESISDLYSQAFTSVSDLVASIQKIKNDTINIINLPSRMADDIGVLFDRIESIYFSKQESFADVSPSMSTEQQDILGNTVEVKADIQSTKEKEQSILEAEIASDLDKRDSDYERDKFTSFKKLFDFNKDSTRISEFTTASVKDLNGNDAGVTASVTTDIGNEITTEQAEIISNEKLLSRLIRVNALSSAYLAAIGIEYSSIEDITETQNTLEDQYQLVISDVEIPSETYKALQNLRDAVESYFFFQKLTNSQVSSIEINTMPAQVLTFALYGDVELNRSLVELNNAIDVSTMSGTVQVITE